MAFGPTRYVVTYVPVMMEPGYGFAMGSFQEAGTEICCPHSWMNKFALIVNARVDLFYSSFNLCKMRNQGCTRADIPDPLFESESTETQRDTEIECEPYFVDLTTLGDDQLIHLRQTGLLSDSGFDVQLLCEKHADYLSQVWLNSLGGKLPGWLSQRIMMCSLQRKAQSNETEQHHL